MFVILGLRCRYCQELYNFRDVGEPCDEYKARRVCSEEQQLHNPEEMDIDRRACGRAR
jgi:hypothetical protein